MNSLKRAQYYINELAVVDRKKLLKDLIVLLDEGQKLLEAHEVLAEAVLEVMRCYTQDVKPEEHRRAILAMGRAYKHVEDAREKMEAVMEEQEAEERKEAEEKGKVH